MANTFLVGDKVIHMGLPLYGVGKIIFIDRTDFLIEFNTKRNGLHSGGGIGKSNQCWWAGDEELSRSFAVEETPRARVIRKIKQLDTKFLNRKQKELTCV